MNDFRSHPVSFSVSCVSRVSKRRGVTIIEWQLAESRVHPVWLGTMGTIVSYL